MRWKCTCGRVSEQEFKDQDSIAPPTSQRTKSLLSMQSLFGYHDGAIPVILDFSFYVARRQ